MGKKILWEDAEKLGASEKHNSIYAKPNKYGYKIAINHPKIKPLYERYKRRNGILIPSPKERFEFEAHIMSAIQKHKEENT